MITATRLLALILLCCLLAGCAMRAPQKLYHAAYCDKMGYSDLSPNWTIEWTGSVIMRDPCPQDYELIIADEDHPAVCRNTHSTCQHWATPCGKLHCAELSEKGKPQ